jgi:hypothetical protein
VTTPAIEVLDEPRNPLLRLVWAWNRFWFRPADPTLLGLIRICVGLVTLYVHAAYTVDLYEFLGPDAWEDAAMAAEFRNDLPWQKHPFNDWDARLPYEPPGGTPDEMRAQAEYMHKFVPPPDQLRDRKPLDGAGRETVYGPNPRQVFRGYSAWSIWFHVTDPTWMMVIHVFILVSILLFAIGFCTRVTSVLTWLGALCYLQRSQITLFGQDTMMNILLLYLMIGPSGAALSVDRLIRRYWLTWRALRAHRPVPVIGPPPPMVSANLALRLIQVNLLWIYFMAGMSKLQGRSWWSGTATWLTWMNWEFSPLWFAPFREFLGFLSEYRPLWETCLAGSVVFTFFVELAFPFLVWWPRMRGIMMASAFVMHLGIGFTMALWTFSLMMMCMVLAFLPQQTVHRLIDWFFAGPDGLRLRFSGRDRGQARTASVVHAFDVWNQVELHEVSPPRPPRAAAGPAGGSTAVQAATLTRTKPAATAAIERLELTTADGERLTGYPLVQRVVRSLRLLWPMALLTWIPGVPALGRAWLGAVEAE